MGMRIIYHSKERTKIQGVSEQVPDEITLSNQKGINKRLEKNIY
jgi:hypothetical protein